MRFLINLILAIFLGAAGASALPRGGIVTPSGGALLTTFAVAGAGDFHRGIVFKKGTTAGCNNIVTNDGFVSVYQVYGVSTFTDGSCEFALVSGRSTSAGTIHWVTGTSPDNGEPSCALIASATATVVFTGGISGTASLASLLASPSLIWASGPAEDRCIYITTIAYGGSRVRVLFETARYRVSGNICTTASIDNGGWPDHSQADVLAAPTVTINGTVVYNPGTIPIYAWAGFSARNCQTAEAAVTPNPADIMATKLMPNLNVNFPPDATTLNALYQSHTPYSQGPYHSNMENTGGTPYIGWTQSSSNLYFTSGGDSRALASIQASALALQSYAHRCFDHAHGDMPLLPSQNTTTNCDDGVGGWETPYPCTMEPGNESVSNLTASISGTVLNVTAISGAGITVGDHPTLGGDNAVMGFQIASAGSGSGGTGTYNLYESGSVSSRSMIAAKPLCWDGAHHPESGYTALLLTGEYIYYEELETTALASMFLAFDNSGRGSFPTRNAAGQDRQVAWYERNVTQFMALSPSNQMRADLGTALAYEWATFLVPNVGLNPIGIYFDWSVEANDYGPGLGPPWQQNFMGISLEAALDLDVFTGSAATNLASLAASQTSFAIGVANGNGTGSGGCYSQAASYNGQEASTTTNNYHSPPYQASFNAYWLGTATAGYVAGSPCTNTLNGGNLGDPESYWSVEWDLVNRGFDHGRAGASTALGLWAGASCYALNSCGTASLQNGVTGNEIPFGYTHR